MLKMTLWFDSFDSLEEQKSQLKKTIKFSEKENVVFSIVGINYSKEIFAIIEKNKNIITHVSYENLVDNSFIETEDGKKEISYISRLDFVKTVDGSTYKFGEFDLAY